MNLPAVLKLEKDVPKFGRNQPCPCGSGKKYKHCCIHSKVVPLPVHKQLPQEPESSVIDRVKVPQVLLDKYPELQEKIGERTFDSIDEVHEILEQVQRQRNHAGLDDFQGLSPAQMHHAHYNPFGPCEWWRLFAGLNAIDLSNVPFLKLFLWLAEELGEDGVKATAKGNLPVKLCNHLNTLRREQLPDRFDFAYRSRINTETEFQFLHVVRLTAGMAGLLRKYKSKFVLTKKAKKWLLEGDLVALYKSLFTAYVSEYNWAYTGRGGFCEVMQDAWLFNLYLLSKHGETPLDTAQYSRWFTRAFPGSLASLQSSYRSPRDALEMLYRVDCINHFAERFGLVKVVVVDDQKFDPLPPLFIQKTPLLDAVLQLT